MAAFSNRSAFWRAVKLCVKELREILRDRRTIITLVLMPILVYPLLAVIFQRIMVSMAPSVTETMDVFVGVESKYEGNQLINLLAQAQSDQPRADSETKADNESQSPTLPKLPGVPTPPQVESNVEFRFITKAEIREHYDESLQEALDFGRLHLVVQSRPFQSPVSQASQSTIAATANSGVPAAMLLGPVASTFVVEDLLNSFGFPANRPGGIFTAQYDPASAIARAGLKRLEEDFDAVNRRGYETRLLAAGQRSGAIVELQRAPTIEAEEATTGAFSTLVPLILILMTIAGGVYPAIDLTAGERERGTLEMLAAAPVPRIAILAGKYVAVVTVAVLTALVNLLGMAITLAATGMSGLVMGAGGFDPLILLQVFGLLVLFASFFSAVLLALTSFARSFKEAQAYLIPLMLFSLAPGLLALTPGLQLSLPLAVTPLVNMVLLARDVMAQNVEVVPAIIAIVATILYAAAAVSVAASIFGADAVLYGGTGSWAEMLKRPRESSATASPANALLCLAVLFPAFFLLSSYLGQFQNAPMLVRLNLGALVTVFLFVLLPVVAANMGRVRSASGLQLWLPRYESSEAVNHDDVSPRHRDSIFAFKPFSLPAMLGIFAAALCLGFALWPLAHELVLLSMWFTPSLLDESKMQLVLQMLAQWNKIPLPLILLCMAVAPAACEEFFFRGYLFAAFRSKMNGWQTVLLTSLLFGVFHVVTSAALAPERFLPSTFLGLILGVIAWRTRSIWPGVLLHVVHNGLLLSMAYYRKELAAAGWGLEEVADGQWGAGDPSHLPIQWLAVAGLVVLLACGLMWLSTRTFADKKEQQAASQ